MKKKIVKKETKPAKKKLPSAKGQSSKKEPSASKLQSKLTDLYNKNKKLQAEINKTKKIYEQLEQESVKLTKELMEAGYKPKI
jgi:predicted RNase H-like nuclease (RuvC/YqgF family)